MAKKGKTKASVRKTSPKSEEKSNLTTPESRAKASVSDSEVQLPFTRMNYILLLVGIGLIALGFMLMSLDDFIDATEFSISLYIAPPIVVLGFLEIIYAIMYRPKEKASPESPA